MADARTSRTWDDTEVLALLDRMLARQGFRSDLHDNVMNVKGGQGNSEAHALRRFRKHSKIISSSPNYSGVLNAVCSSPFLLANPLPLIPRNFRLVGSLARFHRFVGLTICWRRTAG